MLKPSIRYSHVSSVALDLEISISIVWEEVFNRMFWGRVLSGLRSLIFLTLHFITDLYTQQECVTSRSSISRTRDQNMHKNLDDRSKQKFTSAAFRKLSKFCCPTVFQALCYHRCSYCPIAREQSSTNPSLATKQLWAFRSQINLHLL